MNSVVIGALMALSMVQQTDTTVAVGEATLLDVEAMAGSVVVTVWDRDEVRIRADHSRRTYVNVHNRGRRISVEPDARRGPASRADLEITVPADMDVKIEGFMVSISVDGVMGNVEAETLNGDVTVRGGRGTIKVASMSGSVLVEGAQGLIDVESAAQEVRIVDSSGQILGETMGGNFVLQNVRATSVDVGSVGGHIWYDGSYDPDGTYFFGTHGGSITLVVPEGTSAQFDLSTVFGEIEDNLSGELTESEDRGSASLSVGAGGAIVEAETFGGLIQVLRKGTEGEVPEPSGDWDGDWDGMVMDFDLELGPGMLEGLSEAVSAGMAGAFSSADWAGRWSGEWAASWARDVDWDAHRDGGRHREGPARDR